VVRASSSWRVRRIGVLVLVLVPVSVIVIVVTSFTEDASKMRGLAKAMIPDAEHQVA
jgi:hypothetical protein